MTDTPISGISADISTIYNQIKEDTPWKCEWRHLPGDKAALVISVPNGRNVRELVVTEARAKVLLTFDFKEYRVLGDYTAINDSKSGYFEALLQSADPMQSSNQLSSIPGSQAIYSEEQVQRIVTKRGTAESSVDLTVQAFEQTFRKVIIKDDTHPWHVEISPMTAKLAALTASRYSPTSYRPSLKIFNLDAAHHDTAVLLLEKIGSAVLFDLDVCYNSSLALAKSRQFNVDRYNPKAVETPPNFPRMQYPQEALSLYYYGRSSTGTPLLQFLAYYQVLEFFFPMYSQEEVLKRLALVVKNPRFDSTNNSDLLSILNVVSANSRSGYGNEIDQLKATIDACLDEITLQTFFANNPEFFASLANRRTIRDVPAIDLNNKSRKPLRGEVAERIYAIRCRVVHTKSNGSESAVELLLPESKEARALAADNALMQFLAQTVIIASGSSLSWSEIGS